MAAPSSAPTNLNATATGPIIIVSWAATAGATRYAIFRRPVGGSWGTGEIAIVGSQRYFHDWDVTANTNYEYSVQAGNADGFGPHPSSSQRPTAHSHGSADDVMSITIANSGDNVLLTPSAYSYGGGVGTRGYDFFRRKTGDSRFLTTTRRQPAQRPRQHPPPLHRLNSRSRRHLRLLRGCGCE